MEVRHETAPACSRRCTLAVTGVAVAQTDDGSETKNPVEDCQVQPDQKSGQPQNQTGEDGQPGSNDSLTETLNPCDGVLKPPATGDKGLTEPPPNAGETPVIRPGEVPQQQPKQD